MEFHDLANLFPLLEGDEYQTLLEDMKANGQVYPIWTYEGKIIDGRNRYRVCQELRVEPYIEDYTGENPKRFVISQNMARRHMAPGQRAMWAAKNLLPDYEKELGQGKRTDLPEISGKSGEAIDLAGRDVGVSGDLVQYAKNVMGEAPELVDEVVSGRMALSTAHDLSSEMKPIRTSVVGKVKTGEVRRSEVRGEIRKQRVSRGLDTKDDAEESGGTGKFSWVRSGEEHEKALDLAYEFALAASRSDDTPAQSALRRLIHKAKKISDLEE